MKTAYEIAWNLLEESYNGKLQCNLWGADISRLTGITEESVLTLKNKKEIIRRLPRKEDFNILRQVMEEIEQGKPHWEIGEGK